MQSTIIDIYENRINDYSDELGKLKKRLSFLAVSRLIVFIIGGIAAYYLFEISIPFFIIVLVVAVVSFLWLVKLYDNLHQKCELLEELVQVNVQEIEAQKMNFTDFPSGEEFNTEAHAYTYDLDVFGVGSIFQFVNRTTVLLGKKLLADWFATPLLDAGKIGERQVAVAALREKLDFRQTFQATGNLFSESPNDQNIVVDWLRSANHFGDNWLIRALPVVIPIASVMLIGLWAFDILALKYLGIYLLLAATIAWRMEKVISKHHIHLAAKQKLLNKYVDLIKLVEEEGFESDQLKSIKDNLINEKKASRLVRQLSVLTSALDTRRSFVPVVLNIISLRDLGNVIQLEKWKGKHGADVELWFQSVAELDAFISLGGFAFNYPGYSFPDFSAQEVLNVEAIGHPLIFEENRVANDFKMDRLGTLRIITGANMAGKSTFLRTLGVNLVLAMMGSVVCAQKFEFVPIALFTGMRTKDSLLNDESYFRAELNRLKLMIDRLLAGEKLFVLLDELLKGTNSQDQHLGSVAIIKKLINHEACGCLATHDLELSKLESAYPEHISNSCFEVDLDEEELRFDYKLKKGVSQNMNASFLLKKMGIT